MALEPLGSSVGLREFAAAGPFDMGLAGRQPRL